MKNKIDFINQTLHDRLKEVLDVEVHYVVPSKNTTFPYLAFRYVEESEDYFYNLTIETWTKNEDIEGLEEMLETIKKKLNKTILFKEGTSFRFYYKTKGDIEQIENSDVIGRDIIFEMKIC